MKLEDWNETNDRLNKCLDNIEQLPRHCRRDCRRMSRTVIDLLRVADSERVISRRRSAVTPRFEEYMTRAQEALTNLEGHVIFARLMKVDNED